MIKNRFLKGQSRAGMRISRLAEGTLRTELLTNADGLHGLSKAIARLEADRRRSRTPSSGPLRTMSASCCTSAQQSWT